MEKEEHAWEISKENIQPLRQGRDMSALTAALHTNPLNQEFQLKEEQNQFELELRDYEGDDLLDVWHRYINWTEQHYPKGFNDGNLQLLIERCLKLFMKEDKYKNDHRYFQAWQKFAQGSSTPDAVYAHMFDKAIASQLADFYFEWARQVELMGNIKKAEMIYEEGVKRHAEPFDDLKRRQAEFQRRMVERIRQQMTEPQDAPEIEESRTALAGLKGKVGTTRTGRVSEATGPRLAVQRSSLTTGSSNRPQEPVMSFKPYVDENQAPVRPAQTNEWKNIPTRKVDNRENEQKPSTWKDVKMKQKNIATPVCSKYEIHEDPFTFKTPHKPVYSNTKPLSDRKPKEKVDSLSKLDEDDKESDRKEVPAYDKHKIYNGLLEFSFEELRARKYWKQEKEREKVEQQMKIKKLEEALLQQNSEMSRMKAFLKNMGFENMSFSTEMPLVMGQAIGSTLIQDSKETNPAAVRAAVHQDCSLTAENLTQENQCPPPRSANSTITPTTQDIHLSTCHSGNSTITPKSTDPTPVKNSSFVKKRAITAPSPTVTTKEAIGIVRGMFNSSNDNDETNLSLSCCGSQVASSQPFQIREDQPFQIREDPPFQIREDPPFQIREDPPFQILEDPPFQICEDPPFKVHADAFPAEAETESRSVKPTFQIYTEEPMDTQSAKKQPLKMRDTCVSDPVVSSVDGSRKKRLQSYKCLSDTHLDYEIPVDNMGKSSCRSLRLSENEDVEMTDVDKLHCEDTIQWQATIDKTLAPLEMLNELHARAVSTPCVQNAYISQNSGVESSKTESTHLRESETFAPADLSPIMENSEGTSSEESRSTTEHSQMNGLLRSRHASEQNGSVKCHSVIEEGDEEEVDVNPELLNASHHHEIDTTTYLPDNDEATQALLNQSISVYPKNPFDEETIGRFLSQLDPPLSSYPNYSYRDEECPDIVTFGYVYLDNMSVSVDKCIGEGGFAKIFAVSYHNLADLSMDDTDSFSATNDSAIKVQKPACYWEFYISSQLHKRLSELNLSMDVKPSVLSIQRAFFFNDASVIQMQLARKGTILDYVNKIVSVGLKNQIESFACLLTIQLLHLFEQIHRCQIIHGDVKPDNFLINDIHKVEDSSDPSQVFGNDCRLVLLIDYGQSIDMTMFPRGTCFTAKVTTSGFQCIEMRTEKPWTFQTDLFGLAGTIHVVLFGSYMKVFQERGVWKTVSNFTRKWNVPLWKKFFHQLLNIPTCDKMPDLASLRSEFEIYFMEKLVKNYNSFVEQMAVHYVSDFNL